MQVHSDDVKRNASTSGNLAIAYDCLFPASTGGGERQYVAFARELISRGYSVDYLTSTFDDVQETPFNVVAVCGPLRLYNSEGVRRIGAALTYALGLSRALMRRRHHYDAVIVSGLPIFNVFAARLALLGSGTKLVVDYLEVWGLRQWREYAGNTIGGIAWALQRLAIKLTPTATCHSQLSAGRLVAEGLRSRPVVSPGLIDTQVDCQYRDVPADPPVVLYVGRHIAEKRVETIPAAVREARKSIPGLRAIILGQGPTTAEVVRSVEDSDAGEWVTLPGFVSETELDELMAAAACLVHPSQREGYGLVVVEAAGRGTPVVLVAHEGNAATELVSDGINGVVASSHSPQDMGAAILRVVKAGRAMRSATRTWYEESIQTRTIRHTITGILDAVYRVEPLRGDGGRSS